MSSQSERDLCDKVASLTSQLAESERALAMLKIKYRSGIVENSRLDRDKARLDWLADPNNQIGCVRLPTQCVHDNLDSLRGAIDDAMELNEERSGHE